VTGIIREMGAMLSGGGWFQGGTMPYVTASDGVRLYYEEAGSGTPIVFVHEFSGDFRSWEAQMQHFSRRYRCIAFNARCWLHSRRAFER